MRGARALNIERGAFGVEGCTLLQEHRLLCVDQLAQIGRKRRKTDGIDARQHGKNLSHAVRRTKP